MNVNSYRGALPKIKDFRDGSEIPDGIKSEIQNAERALWDAEDAALREAKG